MFHSGTATSRDPLAFPLTPYHHPRQTLVVQTPHVPGRSTVVVQYLIFEASLVLEESDITGTEFLSAQSERRPIWAGGVLKD